MANNTPCLDGAIALYCGAACCYLPDKMVGSHEVPGVGLNNLINRDGGLFLAKDPMDGACVFLDKELSICSIYETRPEVCRTYTCHDDKRVDAIVNALDKHDQERSRSRVEELIELAKKEFPNLSEREALEAMFPDIL
jgi:Fe-S-cluster containining protein